MLTFKLVQQPSYQQTLSPRERYLGALADAEAQYFSALARDEAILRQRLQDVLLQEQRNEVLRRRLLFSRYQPYDDCSCISAPCHYGAPSVYDLYQEQARRQQQEEQQRRLLAAYRAGQEDGCLNVLRQQEGEPFHQRQECGPRTCRLQRQREVGLKRKEEARRTKELEDFFRALVGGPEPRSSPPPVDALAKKYEETQKPSQEKLFVPEPKPNARKDTSAPKTGFSTLKEQLDARLGDEYHNEVRDTIQAILASLFQPQPASEPTTKENPKGKAKAVPSDVPRSTPTSKDILHSLEQIDNVEAHFSSLESEFVFPRVLDFTPPSSPVSTDAESPVKLPFTAANAPIHNYTHALSSLLGQLDAVDSYGNEEVRSRRKDVVIKVEGALEDVERIVEEKGILSRRASVQSLKKEGGAVVEDDGDKKALAKEWLVTEAFKSPSLSPLPELSPVLNVPDVSDIQETFSRTVDEEDVAMAIAEQAFVAQDIITDSESAAVDDSIQSPPEDLSVSPKVNSTARDEAEQEFNPIAEHVPENVTAIIEPSTLESFDEAAEPLKEDVSESVATIRFMEPDLTMNPDTEKQEQADTFLLPTAEPTESLSKFNSIPLEEDTVVVDEGSDWSEVDA